MVDPIAKLLGEWSVNLNVYSIILRVILSVSLAAIIGCERATKRHSAGLRTFMIISLATTLTMLLDIYLQDFSTIDFSILPCAAIIGVAVISVHSLLVSSKSQIKGLTTAAGLWACAIIGLTSGAGFYTATLISFIVLLVCLSLAPPVETYLKNRSNHFEIHLELKNSSYLENFVSTIRKLGLKIDDIELNQAYAQSNLSVYSIALSINNDELKKYKTHKEIIEALSTIDYICHIEEMSA